MQFIAINFYHLLTTFFFSEMKILACTAKDVKKNGVYVTENSRAIDKRTLTFLPNSHCGVFSRVQYLFATHYKCFAVFFSHGGMVYRKMWKFIKESILGNYECRKESRMNWGQKAGRALSEGVVDLEEVIQGKFGILMLGHNSGNNTEKD